HALPQPLADAPSLRDALPSSAISDREVLNTHMGFEAEPEVHLLNAELDEAHRDPEVCDAVHELGVDYALDFGPRELRGRSAAYTDRKSTRLNSSHGSTSCAVF